MRNYPLPRIEDIFRILQGGKRYTELDLKRTYMQISVETASRKFLTIATHIGYLRYTKSAEGIASENFRANFRKLLKIVCAVFRA